MSKTIYDYQVKNLQGKEVDLATLKGKVVMVVNTATKCGFTPQLEDLENLYKEYKSKGLEIIAFPSNDFNNQEPLDGEKITEFCQVNYGVSFPMMEKVHVKGEAAHPVFQFLSKKELNGKINSRPRWNFHKYIIDKNGKVRDFFFTFTKPTSGRVVKKIEELLSEPS